MGAAQAPTRVQGQRPGGGPGGKASESYWVFRDSKYLLTCLVAPFFMSQQIFDPENMFLLSQASLQLPQVLHYCKTGRCWVH